ncbi:hypothetical protein C6558_27275 [Ensifer sp. NM-2]|uniref:hypothetical protein n=1 Tax=Ensifer sp. NM-2 TaxID=2109730 RepID=UPI00070A922F|nr:hypothetical protein [Ensifer sp. NM-2]KQW78490.1 hypothetical protein ASD03_25715 [Ensifer sp. Root127]PSS61418.1 hypothetical protein C6558_27275 [Ensifer sp. NM-2]
MFSPSAVELVGFDHLGDLILVHQLPFPPVADDVAPDRSADPLTETGDRVDADRKCRFRFQRKTSSLA